MRQKWMESAGLHWHLQDFLNSSWLLQLSQDINNLRSFLVTSMGNGKLRKVMEFPDNHGILPCILV